MQTRCFQAPWRVLACIGLLLCTNALAQTMAADADKAVAPRHVLLFMSFNSNAAATASPWAAEADALKAKGVALAAADAPSGMPAHGN